MWIIQSYSLLASRLLGGDFVCGEMTVNPRILFLLDIVYLTSPTFKRLVQARFKFIPEFILLQCCKQSLIKMCNYIFIAKWTMFSNKPKIFGLVISVIVCAQTVFFFPGIWRAPERRVNKSPSCYILLGWSKAKKENRVGTPGISWGGVPPGSSNPDPISDQKMSFSTPVIRPGL